MGKKPSHPELDPRSQQSLYSFQLKNQRQILREKLTWVLAGLGIGLATAAGIAVVFLGPNLPGPVLQQPQSSPETALNEGLKQGMRAAELAQTAELKEDWIAVAMLWQNAINQLQKVSFNSSDYDLAQQKISEYRRNLEYSESNVTTRPSGQPATQDYWTLGSDRELVLATQGMPNKVQQVTASCYETLHYDNSIIEIENGYVKSYDNFDNNLKVLEVGDMALATRGDTGYWTLGASKDQVTQIQGTPDRSDDFQSEQITTLHYGDSFIFLNQDQVIGYLNSDNTLKVAIKPSLPAAEPAQTWTIGSTRLEVLQAQQQTPQAISRNDQLCEEVFNFGNSEVYFRQGIVTGYRNTDQNLKLR